VYITDNNRKAQFNDGIGGNGKQESRACKFDKTGKPGFVSVPDRRVIDRNTFKRLKSKAVVVTAEDRRKVAENMMADRETLENQSAARKQKLQSYDILRTKGKQLTQVKRHTHIQYTI